MRADLAGTVVQQVDNRDRRLRNTGIILSSDFTMLVCDLMQSYAPPTRSLVSHKIDDSICADQFAIVVRSHRLARSFDPCCVSELHTSNRPAGAITEKLVPRLKASGYPQACVVTAVAIHPHSGMSSESENTIASAAQFGEIPLRFAAGSGHVDNVLYPAAGCSSSEMPS